LGAAIGADDGDQPPSVGRRLDPKQDRGGVGRVEVELDGPRRGTTEVLIDNLPGFGDNLKTGLNGRFWLGFAAPRKAIVDRLSDKPFLRKAVMRLPKFLRPAAEQSSHVIAFDGDGVILMNMQDPAARYPTLTCVLETRDHLYLTTLYGNALPVIAKQDL
jgi:hypothetical protein